jgi:carbonic anhydrase/acetyltransferase-like protein (isoleucine patch superfamily)
VVVGEHSLLIAQVGISGSATIGRGVVLAGQTGVAGHITIGDRVIVSGKSGVAKSIPPGQVVSGNPTMPHQTYLRSRMVLPACRRCSSTAVLGRAGSRTGSQVEKGESNMEINRKSDLLPRYPCWWIGSDYRQ